MTGTGQGQASDMGGNGDVLHARDRLVDVARLFADPVRMAVLERLAVAGASSAGELATLIGVSQPRLSNHLAHLRAAQLVAVTRVGRSMQYMIANPEVNVVLAALRSMAGLGALPSADDAAAAPFLLARTCYDHIGGRLGVALFDALREAGVLGSPGVDDSPVPLGPDADEVLASAFAIDVDSLSRRRQLACVCLDATERRPHLGGALGAAILEVAAERGWVEFGEARTLRLTPRGERALRRTLGIRDVG